MRINFQGRFNSFFEKYPFRVVDIGARGGIRKEWRPLLTYLQVIAFEPDPVEYDNLVRHQPGGHVVWINSALYDSKSKLSLHLTKMRGLSSVYPPNAKFLKRFDTSNTHGFEVEKKIEIPADRMDAVLSPEQSAGIDFLKIDVEGCAAPVLKGAADIFSKGDILGVRVEAEFNEKYAGQQLFGEVDGFLRPYGYELYHIQPCYWKSEIGLKTAGLAGQLIHGDFFYFLKLDFFFKKTAGFDFERKKAQTLKYAVFACLYGFYDLAADLIHEAARLSIFNAEELKTLQTYLRRSQGFLGRIPKLKGRGPLQDAIYHAFMLCFGIWMEQNRYWSPDIVL